MLSVVTSLLAGSWLERVADRLTQAGEEPLHNETGAEAPPESDVQPVSSEPSGDSVA
jgi:hypothetical protein